MEIIYYPDNSSYVKLDDSKPNSYYKEITFRINKYKNLWQLAHVVDAIYHNRGFKPTIIIPNLLDAQADRRFNDNESSGLKLVLRFLKGLKVKKYKIFHPHNPELVEGILNNVKLISNKELLEKTLTDIKLGKPFYNLDKDLILMSSDAGGRKPLEKLADEINWKGETYAASKYRSWDEVDGTKFIQEIDRHDFGGKDILIVDDISVYGGTFKGISSLLRGKNVGDVYLLVSHMTVKNLGKNPVTDFFKKVYTSNSKYEDYIFMSEDKNHGTLPTTYPPSNLHIFKLF